MGGCIGKKSEETDKLVKNQTINKYIYKVDVIITKKFMKFKKNTVVSILLCDNDLVIKSINNSYSILYQNIIEWGNYGYYYWNLVFMCNNNKYNILFSVEDSKSISEKLENITKNLKLYYKDL